MAQRKFYRTMVTLEILSEDIPSDDMSLEDLSYAITDGAYSGRVTWGESEKLNGAQMAAALLAQDSDPSFFWLNEDGAAADE